MNNLVRVFVIIVGVLLLLAHGGGYAEQNGGVNESTSNAIPSDSAIQVQIGRTWTASTEDVFFQELQKLKDMDDRDRRKVVPQLILHSLVATNMSDGMAGHVLIWKMGYSKQDILQAIVPYTGTKDPKLRNELWNKLMGLDKSVSGGEPDFGLYQTIVEGSRTNPPQGLIQYMYERSTAAALKTMARVYGPPGLADELSAEVEKDKTKALESFSNRSEWWAHLYVAETMKKNPQLGDPTILKKLEKDDNPLVREKVAEIPTGGGAH